MSGRVSSKAQPTWPRGASAQRIVSDLLADLHAQGCIELTARSWGIVQIVETVCRELDGVERRGPGSVPPTAFTDMDDFVRDAVAANGRHELASFLRHAVGGLIERANGRGTSADPMRVAMQAVLAAATGDEDAEDEPDEEEMLEALMKIHDIASAALATPCASVEKETGK